MNFLQRFALNTVVTLLQAGVKNPLSLTKERSILVQIRDLINQVLDGIPVQ